MNEYLQKLYEDERLTDELQDEVAQTLLAWAQAEYTRLMETHTDKTQLETQLKRVRTRHASGQSIDAGSLGRR
ncbi:MAG UNVERIFIED_CONTAM: hypothetical protein LVT10_09685 [Anaerolineae bacterium]|jgi:signal transduction histidine kinase